MERTHCGRWEMVSVYPLRPQDKTEKFVETTYVGHAQHGRWKVV
jgi:hypothetical protein